MHIVAGAAMEGLKVIVTSKPCISSIIPDAD